MTAVDAAVQSKLLGAQQVTIAYRRPRGMSASRYEQRFGRVVLGEFDDGRPRRSHGNGSVLVELGIPALRTAN
jgi:glutamate synthase (NADPH/NADH) small chain